MTAETTAVEEARGKLRQAEEVGQTIADLFAEAKDELRRLEQRLHRAARDVVDAEQPRDRAAAMAALLADRMRTWPNGPRLPQTDQNTDDLRDRLEALMDFLCYLHDDDDRPLIRPAEVSRPWMDEIQEAFAYRCLPLNIANAHGWEILTPAGFEAYWRGGPSTADVIVRPDVGMPPRAAPVSMLGHGILTFHVLGVFRTPPGWNLLVGGPPNSAKDGVAPLSGIIETDWAPYPFTMNWRFTRREHWVRFEAGEPICFIQPVQRGALERMNPKFVPLSDNPDAARQFAAWNESRGSFLAEVAKRRPSDRADKWQKRYYRGLDMDDKPGVADHQAKLRLKPFAHDGDWGL
jgi:Family of unknown function (DUF6065)